jgi:Uma2 family endonuclease
MMTNVSMPGRMFAHAQHGTTIEENRQMHMATKTRPWTRADLQHLPDDGNRYEVVRGELFVTPAPSPRHQDLLYMLAEHLRRYVQSVKLGEVRQGPDAVVFEGSEVQPDILVRQPVFPRPEKWENLPIPQLVVEVLSTATRRRDLVEKKSLYADAGIPEYWIVDGQDRSFRVVGRDGERVEKAFVRWQPAGAAEPFVLDVPEFFCEALGQAD